MDGDSKRQDNQTMDSNYLANVWDVLQPTWLRRLIQGSDGLDRFLLDYGLHFLCPFSLLLYTILLITKI